VEILAVLIMIVAGAATAVFALVAFALARNESPGKPSRASGGRDQIAGSLLYQVLVSGADSPDEALRRIRREAGIAAVVTRGIEVTSWAEAFVRSASDEQRAELLETAVRMVAGRGEPVSVRQYSTLLDLSFGLGFQTDALARLRERYGFDYVDHAKHGRPRDADRAGGATPLFEREQANPRELLRVLELEGTPTRQMIIASYRRLVAKHHPDKTMDRSEIAQEQAAARFIEITRAYERLLAIYRD
jgi:hypothetical protein